MAKKRSVSKKMTESLILAKLYKDKIIIVETAKKKVVIDARRGELVKRYKEESYEDIVSILDRTAIGLRIQGYDVEVKRLEIMTELVMRCLGDADELKN